MEIDVLFRKSITNSNYSANSYVFNRTYFNLIYYINFLVKYFISTVLKVNRFLLFIVSTFFMSYKILKMII